jgi:hypothetical protein
MVKAKGKRSLHDYIKKGKIIYKYPGFLSAEENLSKAMQERERNWHCWKGKKTISHKGERILEIFE